MKRPARWILALRAEFSFALKRAAGRTAAPEALREALRKTPWWRRGHLMLAWAELKVSEQAVGKKDARSLHSAEIAAVAVERLSTMPGGHPDRAALESRYVQAMVRFHRGQFESAARLLEEISAPEPSSLLTLDTYLLALENLGAAELALGREIRALSAFERIPPVRRNAQVQAALRMLACGDRASSAD